MGVKLTEHQMEIVKGMERFAEATANQMLHIMQNHGLDKVPGFYLSIDVNPGFQFVTNMITIGQDVNLDGGHIQRAKGKYNDEYEPTGVYSPEYALLFANEAVRSRLEKIVHGEKPLPPDGLWVGDHRNSDPVDGWEWDLNDSLS